MPGPRSLPLHRVMAVQDYDATGQNGNDYRNSCENWCNIGIYLVDQTPEQGPLCASTMPLWQMARRTRLTSLRGSHRLRWR